MSARHQTTANQGFKNNQNGVNTNRYQTGKIQTTQDSILPPLIPAKGGVGAGLGSGTSFPLLYPEINLGNLENEVIIQLGKPTSHYQKLSLVATSGDIDVSFVGLIKGRAVLFTLDITIDTPSLPTINWPAELEDLPDLPTDEGSRYILHIVGFRDGSEEKYYVINSSGGSGSNLWSDITIDVDKNMQDKKLTNLKDISFHVTTGSESRIDGDDYVISQYIQGSLYGTVTQSQSAGYQGQGVSEIWGRPLTGYLDSSPIASYKTVSADATPTASQVVSEFAADAFKNAVRKTLYSMQTVWDDTTNASEDAHVDFYVMANGTLKNVMQLYGQVGGFRRIQALGDLVVNGSTILGDASADLLYVLATLNSSIALQTDNSFSIGGSGKALANLYSYTWKHSTSGYTLQWITGTGLRGDIPSSLTYEFYINSLLSLGIHSTYLDVAYDYIYNINYLAFNASFFGPSSTEYFMGAQASSRMVINVPTGKDIALSVAGTRKVLLDGSGDSWRPQSDFGLALGDPTHFFGTLYVYNQDVKDFIWIENSGTNPSADGMIRNNGGDLVAQSGGIDRNLSTPVFDSLTVTGIASLIGSSIFLGDSSSDSLAVSAITQFLAGVRFPVTSQSSGYTVTASDCMVRCTSTSNQTMTLPTAVGISGRVYIFYKTAATGTVTIDANGSQTIDGALTQTISTQYGVIRIMSDGANWMII